MLSSVNGAGGTSAGASALEAKRQEILKGAQEQGGAQARAARFGTRQADAAKQFRTPATTSPTQASKESQTAQDSGQTKRVGWEVSLDTKPYTPRKAAAGAESDAAKGSQLDVTG